MTVKSPGAAGLDLGMFEGVREALGPWGFLEVLGDPGGILRDSLGSQGILLECPREASWEVLRLLSPLQETL